MACTFMERRTTRPFGRRVPILGAASEMRPVERKIQGTRGKKRSAKPGAMRLKSSAWIVVGMDGDGV